MDLRIHGVNKNLEDYNVSLNAMACLVAEGYIRARKYFKSRSFSWSGSRSLDALSQHDLLALCCGTPRQRKTCIFETDKLREIRKGAITILIGSRIASFTVSALHRRYLKDSVQSNNHCFAQVLASTSLQTALPDLTLVAAMQVTFAQN